jgi:hypothetical protein
MPVCQRCHVVEVRSKSGVCPSCLDELVDDNVAQANKEQALAESWLRDGLPLDELKTSVKDSAAIARIMASKDFFKVLTDKHATAELRKLFIAARSPLTLKALAKYARQAIRRKRGRKPKGDEPLYLTVYNLRKSGMTFGKIALRVWKDASKDRLARAHYSQALKRGFPPIRLANDKK